MNARTRWVAALCVALGALAAVPARAAAIKSDFVFLVDATGSMDDNIAAVRSGLGDFAAGLDTAQIDARFAIVLFGGAPELVLDFTSSGTDTDTAMSKVSSSGAVSGFQNNHNVNPEAGLECIRIVLGAAANNTLLRTNVGGSGGLSFRGDARKNLILVTDEDSDLPFYSANRFAGQSGTEPPGSITAAWQAEVDATADAVVAHSAFVNMLINRADAPVPSQYGDPNKSVEDPDFTDWDEAATLAALLADPLTDGSLEAQVLQAGLIARAFNISNVNDPDFIANFFAAKITETQDNPLPEVPEPGTMAMMALGLVALARRRRR